MSEEHYALKDLAKNELEKLGFNVRKEDAFQRYIVDVVGEKGEKIVAVECGDVSKYKLSELAIYFDEVFHLPKRNQKPIQISVDDIRRFLHSKLEDVGSELSLLCQGIQKFCGKPQKLEFAVQPDGKFDWRLSDC